MNFDTVFFAFLIVSLTIVVTLLILYGSFGPESKKLIDPFEEDAD
jgi:hypothetical protein